MAKTIAFVETASKKVVEFDKDLVKAKRGDLVIERIKGEGIHLFRVTHFGTIILEIDFTRSCDLFDQITKWHIQSNTDANYLYTVLSEFRTNQAFEVGYKPVNGGGYLRYKNDAGEWVSPEGRTSSQW